MSFSDDSSDPDWKRTNTKNDKTVKLEPNSSVSKPKYAQKFCDKWLNIFHPWLARCDDDAHKPFCRACQCRLDCNRCHLQRHERTTKHARNLEILINKGEGAARQNLSIRQERSKYYQQRKKLNSSLASSQEVSEMGMDTTEDYIEEFVSNRKPGTKVEQDGETAFQFVQTEAAPGDQYSEETVLKQEPISTDGHGDPLPVRSATKMQGPVRGIAKKGVKKERMKLFMQIQKDKNELMDSFKELMGGGSSFQQSPPKEKNHVDLFFESVSSSVKALSPKLIAETKMRVSQLICELELRALTENDVNTSTGTVAGATAAVVVSPETGTAVGNAYIINPTVVHSAEPQSEQSNQIDGGQHYHTLS